MGFQYLMGALTDALLRPDEILNQVEDDKWLADAYIKRSQPPPKDMGLPIIMTIFYRRSLILNVRLPRLISRSQS